MKRKQKLNIKKSIYFKKNKVSIKKINDIKTSEKIKQNLDLKGNLHRFYMYFNGINFLIKNKIIFKKKTNNKLTTTLNFIPIFFFKKQFFIENIKVYNFFKSINFKNFFFDKFFKICLKNKFNVENEDNLNYNKDNENSLSLIKMNYLTNNKGNIFINYNFTTFLNNLKEIYFIIIFLFINKIN